MSQIFDEFIAKLNALEAGQSGEVAELRAQVADLTTANGVLAAANAALHSDKELLMNQLAMDQAEIARLTDRETYLLGVIQTVTEDRDAAVTALGAAQAEITRLQARIRELEGTPPDPLPDGGPARWIAPAGTGDGSTAALAAPLSTLNAQVAAAGPGGVVNLLADQGDYASVSVAITAGGAEGNPVTIRGRTSDDLPAVARIVGSRNNGRAAGPWVYADPPQPVSVTSGATLWGSTGGNFINLADGAAHLRFENLAPERMARAFTLGAVDDITFADIALFNCQDYFYNSHKTMTRIRWHRCTGKGFSKSAFRFSGDSHDLKAYDCDFNSGRQGSDKFAMGVKMDDTAHDVELNSTSFAYSFDSQSGDNGNYWNGDGVTSERGNYNIVINGGSSRFHTDGGDDLKAPDAVIRNRTYEGNKRNLRLWGHGDILIDGITSLNPAKFRDDARGLTGGAGSVAHIWIKGESDDAGPLHTITIKNSTFRNDPGFSASLISLDTADKRIVLVDGGGNQFIGISPPNWGSQ